MIFKPLKYPQKVTLWMVAIFCLVFLGMAFFFPLGFKLRLEIWTDVLLKGFGFYYLLFGLFAVLILLVLVFSKWGKIQLGSDKAEYGWFSWVAMLYSTGMGAGLLLRAVQEPVYYFQNPPRESDLSQTGFALEYSFFHWGLTPWAFYGLFGLLMAYIMYIKKEKALSSSILPTAYQNSPTGVLMNVLTIICTLLGVVAALGLGGRQFLQAIGYVNGFETEPLQAIYVVILISFLATGSALLGLSKGIRNLSNFNIGLATLLLLLVVSFGIQRSVNFEFFGILGTYLYEFIPISLNLGKFEVSQDFLKGWTYFYWAFWLAWAPFTGIFIARVSKGRSIREFVLAVLIIPALGTFLWFTAFGQNAFQLLNTRQANWQDFESIYTGIFMFLDYFPLAALTKIMTLVLVFTFLITSVDSAIFVLSMFSDGGNPEPAKRFRWAWGIMIGLFTIGLMLIGKEALLQSVSQLLIVFALPFSLMFLGMVVYFIRLLFWKKTTI